MLTLCIITTILLSLVSIITFASAVMNYLVKDYRAGHLGLFIKSCCLLAIITIWLLYCN